MRSRKEAETGEAGVKIRSCCDVPVRQPPLSLSPKLLLQFDDRIKETERTCPFFMGGRLSGAAAALPPRGRHTVLPPSQSGEHATLCSCTTLQQTLILLHGVMGEAQSTADVGRRKGLATAHAPN